MAEYLSREQIMMALESLSAELDLSEETHEVLITGGAALVLLYNARESTKDVDAVIVGEGRELKSRYAFEDLWESEHADPSTD